MSSGQIEQSAGVMARLTRRQREVLDLLLLHKTSKEIARDLGISPHTVDQRIRFAKEKLGVDRRSDLAAAYSRLRGLCEKTVYEESHIDVPAIPLQDHPGSSERPDLIDSFPQFQGFGKSPGGFDDVRLVPAIFEGPAAVLIRVGAVFAIAAAMIVVGIGGLAIFEQLSRLLT